MFNVLPSELQHQLFIRIHSFIGDYLLLLITGDTVSTLNIHAIHNLQVDLQFLISFSSKYPTIQKASVEGYQQISQVHPLF